jgi:flagellar M-ring protein FliF
LDYKARVEDYLSGKVEGLLSSALGPNRARVRVDAVIDTSRVNETTETYDNENKVVSKEEMKSRASTPLAASSGNDGKGASGNKTQEEDMVNEYLVSRVVQQKSDLPGKITSITVAAFVDLTPPPVKEGETAAPAALTIKDVEEIIRNAIGLKETDTLKVAQTPFHQPEAAALPLEEPGGRLSDPSFWLDVARQCSLGVLVIGALIALRIFHPKKMANPESGDRLALDGLLGSGKSLPQSVADADPQQLRAQITNALQSNPEEVKRLFLRWVESEKGGA